MSAPWRVKTGPPGGVLFLSLPASSDALRVFTLAADAALQAFILHEKSEEDVLF